MSESESESELKEQDFKNNNESLIIDETAFLQRKTSSERTLLNKNASERS